MIVNVELATGYFGISELNRKPKNHPKFRGGYSHVKAYGDVPPKWVTFSPKSLDMGPILVKKSLEEGPISQKLRKKW